LVVAGGSRELVVACSARIAVVDVSRGFEGFEGPGMKGSQCDEVDIARDRPIGAAAADAATAEGP